GTACRKTMRPVKLHRSARKVCNQCRIYCRKWMSSRDRSFNAHNTRLNFGAANDSAWTSFNFHDLCPSLYTRYWSPGRIEGDHGSLILPHSSVMTCRGPRMVNG